MKYLMLILALTAALLCLSTDANAGGFSRSQTVVLNDGIGGFSFVQSVPSVRVFDVGCRSFGGRSLVVQQGFGFSRSPVVIQRSFRGVLGARFQSQVIR